MNVQLRKRHRVMWMVLGIALPLLCLQALETLQMSPVADIPRVSCPADITDCGITERHEVTAHAVTITVQAGDSISTVNVTYTQPLVSAFTLAYLSASPEVNTNSTLLGGLNEMGSYNFEVPNALLSGKAHLLLYDKLKGNILYHHNMSEQP